VIAPVGGPAALFALIRSQVQAQRAPESRGRKLAPLAGRDDETVRAQLAARLQAIDPDAPDRKARTLHVLVEYALLDALGERLRNDARFPTLVSQVTETMLSEPQLEKLIEDACNTLPPQTTTAPGGAPDAGADGKP
jgi:hypothetical protein